MNVILREPGRPKDLNHPAPMRQYRAGTQSRYFMSWNSIQNDRFLNDRRTSIVLIDTIRVAVFLGILGSATSLLPGRF